MWEMLRPFASRILGGLAGGIAAKAAEKGITVDPAALVSIALTVFAIVHRVVDKKWNPADAASSAIIKEGEEVNDQLNAQESQQKSYENNRV